MPDIDFDMGLAKRVGDIYTSPTVPVEFMPEELFERKRIVDKVRNIESGKPVTFSFISFWRTGFTFDPNRFDPAQMFYNTEGHYNDDEKTSATFFKIYPVIFNYSFIIWDTKREMLDFHSTLLFKNFYLNMTLTVSASDTIGLDMRCYMDCDYKLTVTDEYVLEKSEKVPYYKGKFDLKLEGWLYDVVSPSSGSTDTDIIQRVHTFIYNQNKFFMEDVWVPDPLPGYPEGEAGLPSGADLDTMNDC